MTIETKLCPNCGQPNDTGRSICANCNTPLTAYGGQVGQSENFERRLASQVQALNVRPPVVVAMTIFNALFALFWPVAVVVSLFAVRPHLNAESTNYIGTAVGTVSLVVKCVVMLPVAIVLFGMAYATWTQRTWAWTANAVVLVLAAVVPFLRFGLSFMSYVWVGVACALAFFWFQARTKAWFGLS